MGRYVSWRRRRGFEMGREKEIRKPKWRNPKKVSEKAQSRESGSELYWQCGLPTARAAARPSSKAESKGPMFSVRRSFPSRKETAEMRS